MPGKRKAQPGPRQDKTRQDKTKMCDQNLKQYLCAVCGERIGDVVPTTQIRCGKVAFGACGRVKDGKLATFFVKSATCPQLQGQQKPTQEQLERLRQQQEEKRQQQEELKRQQEEEARQWR
ncbi:hypothetical protein SLS62_007380 [Diatrype stigma]|uniref:Uncharacterized protein n=1 Tax=Diatrype stigma TaxID=117547 RepID=A0AAN9YQS9_9PEZI